MSKLDEIQRDLRTIRQHQSESAAEQMADTLVEHIDFLLTEVDRLNGAGDLWEEERAEILNSRENWRERAESAERVRNEHYARLRQYERYVEELEGAFIRFKTSLRTPPPDPISLARERS